MANEGPTGGEGVDTVTLSKLNRFGANNPQGSALYRAQQSKNKTHKNQLMLLLLQMMMDEKEDSEDKATETYQEELAGDKESSLTPALANNPATALMGPQKPKEEPKDDFKNMLLALLLKSQG